MKLTGPIFVILIFLIIFKYTKLFDVNILIIIGVGCLWFVVLYIQIHLKNKEKKIPQLVRIAN